MLQRHGNVYVMGGSWVFLLILLKKKKKKQALICLVGCFSPTENDFTDTWSRRHVLQDTDVLPFRLSVQQQRDARCRLRCKRRARHQRATTHCDAPHAYTTCRCERVSSVGPVCDRRRAWSARRPCSLFSNTPFDDARRVQLSPIRACRFY